MARAARNKGDMSRGGMTMKDLVNRTFQGGEKAKKAYVTAFKAYEKAANSLSDEERAVIFGPAGEIFYNTEIQGPVAPNVVNYDENILNIHHMGHKKYNRATNQLEIVDAERSSALLDQVVDRFEQATADEPFKVRRTAFLELNKITDEEFVNNTLDRIQSTGYSGDMTINDYLENKLSPLVNEEFPELEDRTRYDLIERILQKDEAISLTQLGKGLPKEEKAKISQYVKNSKFLIKDLIKGIEDPIHDLAVELLRGLRSAYVLNNVGEVKRLKKETEDAIKAIRDYRGPESETAQDILVKQLAKLKHHDNIDTVVEGFVFQYDGQMYKFTGNFAPMNQLLGLFKYGRGKIPKMVKEAVSDLKEADNSKRIIAIYPGRFQPMGRHHAEVFKQISANPDYDEAYIATTDKVDPPRSPFNFEEKSRIAGAHGIDPTNVVQVKNPYYAKEITNNYDPETTSVVYLVGAKDMAENPRFAKTEGTTKERLDWKIEVAPHVEIDIPGFGEMCGTTCRKALKDATEEEFEDIMGFDSPEIYDMVKDRLSVPIQEGTRHFLGIFRGLVEEVLLEEGWADVFDTRGASDRLADQLENDLSQLDQKDRELEQKIDNLTNIINQLHPNLNEEDLEETSAMSAGAVTGYSGKKRNPDEEEVNEALNYLLQKLGV